MNADKLKTVTVSVEFYKEAHALVATNAALLEALKVARADAEAMLNEYETLKRATDALSAEDADWIAEHFQPQVVKESTTGLKLDMLRAYADTLKTEAIRKAKGE